MIDKRCETCDSVDKAGWEVPCIFCNINGGSKGWERKEGGIAKGKIADDHLFHEMKKLKDSSHNNGGATDYYDLPKGVTQCQDIIEWRSMNHSQGSIFKAGFCFNTGRHSGTNYERDLNKIIYFAKRELERIKK